MDSIRCRKGPSKSKFLRTVKSQVKLTLSNAFSASRVMMAVSLEGFDFAVSSTERTFLMLEVAERPFVNPAWAGCMMSGMIFANLLAMIFERILESKFNNEIAR